MKNRFLTSVILIGTLCVFGFLVILKSFGEVKECSETLLALEATLIASLQTRDMAQKALDNTLASSKPASDFNSQWGDTFQEAENPTGILATFDSLSLRSDVVTSNKTHKTEQNYTFLDGSMQVRIVQVTVSGEFSRIIDWLAEAESRFPLARIEQSLFRRDGDTLKLDSTWVFPLKAFDTPSPR